MTSIPVGDFPQPTVLRQHIEAAYRADETATINALTKAADLGEAGRSRVQARARKLVETIRDRGVGQAGLDAFMQEYELSNQEGVTLMCLAEALLRIPDAATADKLIKSKLGEADWDAHLGRSDSIFVNASTWALMLTGRVIDLDGDDTSDMRGYLGKLVAKSGEPVIRQAMVQAMKILGRQFVMGRTIEEALGRAEDDEKAGYRHSFDMLGEAAHTDQDALNYLEAYSDAIVGVGKASKGRNVFDSPGISVKLSALHPRYELAQKHRVMTELMPRLLHLAQEAKTQEIGFTVDAEEADRLDISLDVIEAVSSDPSLAGWNGFGLAVQSYLKSGYPLLEWLADMARRHDRRLMVRLVKGAYWDTEIKLSQEGGYEGYPVFTRKASTDVSYLACARRLLAHPDVFYPQFATHNAHTLAAVLEMAGENNDFEFQRLHGMGEPLYDQIVSPENLNIPCRIYAPVGSHEDLLAYLVRRLLENGANTSFVNRIVDEDAPIDAIIADPVAKTHGRDSKPHPRIPAPADMFGAERRNSAGLDLSDTATIRDLVVTLANLPDPGLHGIQGDGPVMKIFNPARRDEKVGEIATATPAAAGEAVNRALRAFPAWNRTPAGVRAEYLERAAELYEEAMPAFISLCVREAGKTLADAVSEVREAVDFLRYYASRARLEFAKPEVMPGPTGELNELTLQGRGAFVCISPWNFPLAIFTGQIAAALAAGNSVLAKPADQTPLIAARAVDLLHRAGIPADVLQLLPGDGGVGAALVADPRIAGVAFTGSTETARAINQSLAGRDGPIVPLIAETGGQNAMIVDSTALPEQVVEDVIASAFQSAGQRCSALRVLYLQNDIADKFLEMLAGAVAELSVGDPGYLATDVGPVIDADALAILHRHAQRMVEVGRLICEAPPPENGANGHYFAPRAFEIPDISVLEREVFGPILHVIRYEHDELSDVIDAINATGYGLTLGVHSRIDSVQNEIVERLNVGNAYINRNTIGAVVGVQPFGGQGLSGTGPKAGGPRYLHRFAVEKALCVNTTAAGGNAALMSIDT